MATSTKRTALALCGSATLLAVGAVLIWTGTLDLGMDPVPLVTLLGVAVLLDLGMAAYFFMRTP